MGLDREADARVEHLDEDVEACPAAEQIARFGGEQVPKGRVGALDDG